MKTVYLTLDCLPAVIKSYSFNIFIVLVSLSVITVNNFDWLIAHSFTVLTFMLNLTPIF